MRRAFLLCTLLAGCWPHIPGQWEDYDPDPDSESGTEDGWTDDCDIVGFDALSADGLVLPAGFLKLHARNEADDVVQYSVWANYGGDLDPHQHTIIDENFADCGVCVLLLADCDQSGCDRQFLAVSGQATLVRNDGVGGGVGKVELEGLAFVEVTIDDAAVSTKVPGGDVWCVEQLTIEAELVRE